MTDYGYSVTRRQGAPATVVVAGPTATDPATGERQMTTTVYNLQCVAKAQTSLARVIAAQAAHRDIGDTQFVIWTYDVPFTQLTAEDYIIEGDSKYQVVTCERFGTALVITARHTPGTVPVQRVEVEASDDLGIADSASEQ